MTTDIAAPLEPIERFRTALSADPALQTQLGAIDDRDVFVRCCGVAAERLGIGVSGEALSAAVQAGGRVSGQNTSHHTVHVASPPPGWLPIAVAHSEPGPSVDWAYVGDRPLLEPFYADAIRIEARRPINRLLRLRTPLSELPMGAEQLPHLNPNGLIFHMSRCGSTLVAQMLARSPANLVLPEPRPLDEIVRLDTTVPGLAPDRHIALLRGMAAALGQVRRGTEQRYVLKLDSWHILSLPLFRAAFPDTPWVFLYRDPAEVMVSQMRQPGMQMAADLVDPAVFGLDDPFGRGPEDYRARVLGAICRAAADGYASGRGRLVHYRDLPGALFSQILPHFGIEPSPTERAEMEQAATFDAKQPQMPFASDTVGKRDEVTDAIQTACAVHLASPYARLEALRTTPELTTNASA